MSERPQPSSQGDGGEQSNNTVDPDLGVRVAENGRKASKENRWLLIWEGLSRAGLGEAVYRLGTHILSIALVLIVIWGMRAFYLRAREAGSDVNSPRAGALVAPPANAAALPSPTPTAPIPDLPYYAPLTSLTYFQDGIPRRALIHTDIPTRPREEITTYIVQPGDTIFGIAEKFGLRPESVLWGNLYILGDNPHTMQPGIELFILPSDGVYHKWSNGEGLNGVSSYYGVSPETIITWPGNNLTMDTIGDFSNPNIEPGTMLFVPGGERAFVTWSAPFIGRTDPAKARILGPGACGTIMDGAVGIGTFIWPTNNHYLSGYDYSPSTNHFGIDIGGRLGDALFASDNGVIVYAGWNNWGYGNVVVIDHGGGWQTLYAHMDTIGVGCGQSVFQGSVIGGLGTTGNSSGPHLHFEMLHSSYGKVNPWDFLP